MLQLHQFLLEGKYPNCTKVGKRLEVSPKTIQRDLEFMRDRLGLPIEYERARHGYEYTEEVSHFPVLNVTEGELVALLVAQKALEQYKGTSFEGPLRTAFHKMSAGLQSTVSVGFDHGSGAISFRPFGPSRQDLEEFQKISRAVINQREIEFGYQKLRSSKPEARRIQPYHLLCSQDQWYIVGFDLKRKAKRTFALPRITKVRLTERTFIRPADFSIETHFGGAFGVFAGEGDYVITIRFDAFAARLVRERFWHTSQKAKELPGEELELSLHLNSLEEIERWVLSWGGHATVTSPPELIQRLGTITRDLAKRYR
jgi:proteasome accessory factor B